MLRSKESIHWFHALTSNEAEAVLTRLSEDKNFWAVLKAHLMNPVDSKSLGHDIFEMAQDDVEHSVTNAAHLTGASGAA